MANLHRVATALERVAQLENDCGGQQILPVDHVLPFLAEIREHLHGTLLQAVQNREPEIPVYQKPVLIIAEELEEAFRSFLRVTAEWDKFKAMLAMRLPMGPLGVTVESRPTNLGSMATDPGVPPAEIDDAMAELRKTL